MLFELEPGPTTTADVGLNYTYVRANSLPVASGCGVSMLLVGISPGVTPEGPSRHDRTHASLRAAVVRLIVGVAEDHDRFSR